MLDVRYEIFHYNSSISAQKTSFGNTANCDMPCLPKIRLLEYTNASHQINIKMEIVVPNFYYDFRLQADFESLYHCVSENSLLLFHYEKRDIFLNLSIRCIVECWNILYCAADRQKCSLIFKFIKYSTINVFQFLSINR